MDRSEILTSHCIPFNCHFLSKSSTIRSKVRQDVMSTNLMNEYWLKDKSHETNIIVWRYVLQIVFLWTSESFLMRDSESFLMKDSESFFVRASESFLARASESSLMRVSSWASESFLVSFWKFPHESFWNLQFHHKWTVDVLMCLPNKRWH